jgi:hypothetical protein
MLGLEGVLNKAEAILPQYVAFRGAVTCRLYRLCLPPARRLF